MTEINKNTTKNSTIEIHILRMNVDKTRRADKSGIIYNVYFQLSGIPAPVWKTIFEREWKVLMRSSQSKVKITETNLQRGFLVIRCPLLEVGSVHLPVIKDAIAATNVEYEQYLLLQEADRVRKENVWKDERNAVNQVSESLQL